LDAVAQAKKNALFLVGRDLWQNRRLNRFLFLFFFRLIHRLSGWVHEPRGVLNVCQTPFLHWFALGNEIHGQ
jgi:hypothetical protein